MITERVLIEQCSPTLSSIKTASLFTVKIKNVNEFYKSLDCWNEKIAHKGLKMTLLREKSDFALVYLYREEHLKKDLQDDTAKEIMELYGYNCADISQMLEKLKLRFSNYKEFPHEVGLFLGYPPIDVKGFICHKGQNCKLCGYWKVYGDTHQAMIRFAKYDKCKKIYIKLWSDGLDIMRLTVA